MSFGEWDVFPKPSVMSSQMFKYVGTVNRTCSCQGRGVWMLLVGRGRQAGSARSSTHPAVGLSQLLVRRGSPERGHSEIPPKCKQQRAQPFPGHFSHLLGLLCLCPSPPVRWCCSGAWCCLCWHTLGFQLCWRCWCWSPSPSHSWLTGTRVSPTLRASWDPSCLPGGDPGAGGSRRFLQSSTAKALPSCPPSCEALQPLGRIPAAGSDNLTQQAE